ncbi:Endoribonuclease HigB [bioreactor metagenome]|uniref:Endoribonuclease HigB n=1 Tax=bioreactor metagenome TaxID=1076179 RepID=A0A645G7Q8_9ZZZZ
MIESFKQKELEKFFLTGKGKIPQPVHRKRVEKILDLLDAATVPENMNFPGSGFHKLQPPTADRYAVSVSGNWRICFIFRNGNADQVEYIDYH